MVENSLQNILVSCAIALPPPKFINVARNLLARYSSISPKKRLHSSPQPFYVVRVDPCFRVEKVDKVVHGQVGVDIFQRLQMAIRLKLVRPDGRMGSKGLVDERIQRLTVTQIQQNGGKRLRQRRPSSRSCQIPRLQVDKRLDGTHNSNSNPNPNPNPKPRFLAL